MHLQRLHSFAVLLLLSLAAAGDPYPLNPAVDVLHYRFALDISDAEGRIDGDATVEVRFLDDGERTFHLDLVNETAAGGMTVSAVTWNAQTLKHRHENDALTIELPRTSRNGDVFEFRIRYAGKPATGLLIQNNKYGELTAFSDNWPNKARHWLPTVDHISDKATSEMLITAPANWKVVSNGLLLEESNLGNGLRRTHWRQSVPIPPWLFVIGAAKFAVQYVDEFDDKSIQTWVYWQDRDAGFYDFAVPTRRVLEFMSAYVGPFVYEKIANIQSNSVGGGMEAATAVLYSDESVTGERTERWQYVITHEIAHHWFGNAVTEKSWDDVWLSEGFATYFSHLFVEYADGRDAFDANMVKVRDKVFAFYAEHPDYQIVHNDLADMKDVTTSQIYDKGAWVLHMLRNEVGDEHWWTGIQNYYAKYVNSHATTADFQREMESACGCDLDPFFAQWLYQGGNIRLDVGWRFDDVSKTLDIDIAQVQNDGFEFTADVEIGLYDADSTDPDIHSVELTSDGGRLSIPLARKPTKLQIDPRTVLLAEWTIAETTITTISD